MELFYPESKLVPAVLRGFPILFIVYSHIHLFLGAALMAEVLASRMRSHCLLDVLIHTVYNICFVFVVFASFFSHQNEPHNTFVNIFLFFVTLLVS
jgi:hypothetical protein